MVGTKPIDKDGWWLSCSSFGTGQHPRVAAHLTESYIELLPFKLIYIEIIRRKAPKSMFKQRGQPESMDRD